MNRIDRLQAILTTLQSKRVVKAEELATRFDVSIRTIYRDIRALEVGGVPIGAEAGVGYFITEGYYIPPIMFTHQEARALMLAGKIVAKFTDKQIAENFDSALTKVRSVLDFDKKEELESLEKDIVVNPFHNQKPKEGIEELHIDKIKTSLSLAKTINIDYYSGGKGEYTNRTLEPIGLCYYLNAWHLMAYCQLRKDYRDFRLDRVSKLKIESESYSRFKHPSLQEYINKLIDSTELELCVIKVQKEDYRLFDKFKYQMGLIKEVEQDTAVEMHFATFSLTYFARGILFSKAKVKIISPSSLQENLIAIITEMNERYL